MFVLNTTYITTENNVATWKKWLKEEAFSESIAFREPDYKVFRIDHSAEAGQVSFSVQVEFENMAMLHLFQEELELIHQQSLARRLGAQCLYFITVLSREQL